ncbi:MAG: tetratricopeptide repeat protein [Lewinellaceae bacterium]|nr:tetratricopeptide repeat protein [Lewinellaceae bacterium]
MFVITRLQIGTVLGAIVLFAGLYFGFDTKASADVKAAASAAAPAQEVSPETMLQMAVAQLPADASKELAALEDSLQKLPPDAQIPVLKRISGWWYAKGNVPAAGIWAEKVAVAEKTDTAWSVAGATFYQALAGTEAPVVRQFSAEHAIKAFENAAAINPARVEHEVNIALVYAENPPPDNPMKAVLLLRDLENKYPENASVYNALGRLAIKTKQWDRAVTRLEKAYALDPANPNAPCLLAQAYQGQGNVAKAQAFAEICRSNNKE